MLRKKNLKPGWEVRNMRSGALGVILADKKGKLLPAHPLYVQVVTSDITTGRKRYTVWLLEHLRLYNLKSA